MRQRHCLMVALALILAACGSGESGGDVEIGGEAGGGQGSSNTEDDAGGDSGGVVATSGDVVDRQPPGQAFVSVDGLEYTLTEPGGLACSVAPDSVTFSFRIGDNEIVLGGGVSRFDSGWMGDIVLTVGNPEGEPGPISYSTNMAEHPDGPSVDGASMSYVGPMLKQPANDGSNPPQVDVGEGTISATCP